MLNDTKLRKLKPLEKPYRVADQGGLCLEVRPTGSKLWRIRYRYNNKASMISLGEYPIISLSAARKKQEEIKLLLSQNINPATHKQQQIKRLEEANKNNFKTIAEEYLAERLLSKSQRYQAQFKSNLEKDVYPIIATKNIQDITPADVLTIMKNTLKRVQTQSNFGSGEVTAIQNRKFIGAIMRYAIATLRAENDPTYAVRDVIVRPEVNHARALCKDECIQFMQYLTHYTGTTTVRNAVLLLTYSMLRTIEVRRLEWQWVDFDTETITFPKIAMKKNRIHILPMSVQIKALLKEQYQISHQSTYVFPSINDKNKMINEMTINRMLKKSGIHNFSAHDLRATASTRLYEAEYDEKWIELQLAHADSNKTRASYNHAKYINQRKLMLQYWANIIDDWLLI